MRTLRMLVGLLFLGVLASYLLLAGELVEEAQWGTVGALGVLGLAWVRLGGAPKPLPPADLMQAAEQLLRAATDMQRQLVDFKALQTQELGGLVMMLVPS